MSVHDRLDATAEPDIVAVGLQHHQAAESLAPVALSHLDCGHDISRFARVAEIKRDRSDGAASAAILAALQRGCENPRIDFAPIAAGKETNAAHFCMSAEGYYGVRVLPEGKEPFSADLQYYPRPAHIDDDRRRFHVFDIEILERRLRCRVR